MIFIWKSVAANLCFFKSCIGGGSIKGMLAEIGGKMTEEAFELILRKFDLDVCCVINSGTMIKYAFISWRIWNHIFTSCFNFNSRKLLCREYVQSQKLQLVSDFKCVHLTLTCFWIVLGYYKHASITFTNSLSRSVWCEEVYPDRHQAHGDLWTATQLLGDRLLFGFKFYYSIGRHQNHQEYSFLV